MSIPTLEVLMYVPTASEVKTSMLAIAQNLGLRVTSWAAGAVTRTIFAVDAEKLAAYGQIQVNLLKSAFLDTSESNWLTAVADQVYGITRLPAKAGACFVTFTNTNTTGSVTVPAGTTVANSVTGATYRTQSSSGVIPASSFAGNVLVIADLVGNASDSGVGNIDTVVTAIIGVTVANTTACVGQTEETDVDLRARCKLSLGSVSPFGPKNLYDYLARNAATAQVVTRTKQYTSATTGNVRLLAATSSGASSGGDVAIVQAIIDSLGVPLCQTVTVSPATLSTSVAVTSTVSVQNSPLTDSAIQALVAASLAKFASAVPIGGYGASFIVDKGDIERAIFNALPEIKLVAMSAPAADVTLLDGDVIQLGTITTTVVRI